MYPRGAFAALLVLVGCSAPPRPAEGPSFAKATEGKLDPRVAAAARSELEKKRHVGLVVGTLENGAARVQGFGRLSEARPEAPDGRTIFEIGSITKVFSGILLAQLAAEGKVAVSDPAQRHVPEGWTLPSREGAVITLAQLSTHTSGLPRLPSNLAPNDARDPYADYSEERLREFLAGHVLRRRPGDAYEYSNLGTGWLGWMLARADGRTYEDLAIHRIARPLGMADTGIRLDDAARARLAPPHASPGKPSFNWELATLTGAGGLRSTTEDLLRFLAANLGDAPPALLAAMEASHEPRVKVRDGGPWIGLGWHRSTLEDGRTMIWHNGGTGGYRSFAGFVKESRSAVVVLANSTADVDALGVAVMGLLGR